MKFIRGYGYEGEQPRLYAERVNSGGYHWQLLDMQACMREFMQALVDAQVITPG